MAQAAHLASIAIDEQTMDKVRSLLEAIPKEVPKALAGAINDTTKQQKTQIVADIRKKVNIKKKDIGKHISRKNAKYRDPSGYISISNSERLSLAYFGARQTKTGLSYKISKDGKRGKIPGGFLVDKERLRNAPDDAKGHVAFKRAGKKRLPITKLKGPTPYAVFLKGELLKPTVAETEKLLTKNIDRRVKFILLKHEGEV